MNDQEHQSGLFPEDDRLRKLQRDIDESYLKVGKMLSEIGGYGKFFELSSKYYCALNETTIKDIDELILGNVEFAKTKCAKLGEILESCESEIANARAMIADLDQATKVYKSLSTPGSVTISSEGKSVTLTGENEEAAA